MLPELTIRLIPLKVCLLAVLALWAAAKGLTIPAGHPPQPAQYPPQQVEMQIISPIFTAEVQHWAPQILRWARGYQLDVDLVATVMQIESCGAPRAVSVSGAHGLFQVMPFHFAPAENMFDPDINAARGLSYLAQSLALAKGDVALALAGYNGGHSLIGKNPAAWPAEARRYSYWGTGIYIDAKAGKPSSSRLDEWLKAGGASLCKRAAQELD